MKCSVANESWKFSNWTSGDMAMLREILDPNFLLRNSVHISLLVGFAAPLVGMYLFLRRLVFMGVALPQISSCGIAFAFALQGWGLLRHAHETAGERALALLGSTVFTLAAIAVFAALERRGRGSPEARIGAFYVLAGAMSILLLVKNPFGEHGMLDMLKGEIIAVSNGELMFTAAIFLIVTVPIIAFRKHFLMVSFDREMALTLKKRVLFWDALLFTLIGMTISTSVLSVGPLVTFGFLLLPPLIAHQFAATMRQFALISSAMGGLTAFTGFALAYRWDLPVGATDVALLGAVLAVSFVLKKLL
ncbi:MAG TPA: metal ABC transporter permease [Candidatus Binatia bacterium]|nr:metal ABC transporter permease [Candidatus Binatia bacterium]